MNKASNHYVPFDKGVAKTKKSGPTTPQASSSPTTPQASSSFIVCYSVMCCFAIIGILGIRSYETFILLLTSFVSTLLCHQSTKKTNLDGLCYVARTCRIRNAPVSAQSRKLLWAIFFAGGFLPAGVGGFTFFRQVFSTDCCHDVTNVAITVCSVLQLFSGGTIIVFYALLLKKFVAEDIEKNEGTSVLSFIRCSYCKQTVKKCVVLLPNFTQLLVIIVFLFTTRSEAVNDELDEGQCGKVLYYYILIGCAVIFSLYLGTALAVFLLKKRFDRVMLGFIATTIVGASAFWTVGLYKMAGLSVECQSLTPHLFAAALIANALVAGTTVCTAFLAVCCKIESCFYRELGEADIESLSPIPSPPSAGCTYQK